MKAYIKDNKVIIPILEIHASHNCNLKCESCSHYSNNGSGENLKPEILDNQLTKWSEKISPIVLKILGGEPFLNNKLEDVLKVCRRNFPNIKIELSTNGLLLTKVKFNFDCLNKLNVSLLISIHCQEESYSNKMQEVFDFLNQLNVPFKKIESYKRWRRLHFVEDNTVIPFQDNLPRQSWNICLSKNYRQLLDGSIYKCPQVAYINKIKIKIDEKFDIMKQYKPIAPESSLEEIRDFLNKEDEDICSMCPAKLYYFNKKIN